jgi:hypothetical protein
LLIWWLWELANYSHNKDKKSTELHEPAVLLQLVCERIDGNPILQSCILDASVDGDTLVVFCNDNRTLEFVKQELMCHWPFNIEVYCPSDMMVGANQKSSS